MIPVFDIEDVIAEVTNVTHFVIVRTIECSEASILVARAGGPLRWTEDICMKSPISKNILQNIASCYFQSGALSDNQIVPAELFLFHHRNALEDYAAKHPDSKQLIAGLLDYTKHRFGSDFADADSLFSKGLVTQKFVLHLFKPNEFVVSWTYGSPAAFVLQQWPETNLDGSVTLQCWSFQTDGSGFARKKSILSVPPIGPKSANIKDLIAYPLRFAAPKLCEMIRSRGEKHWKHRNSTLITYKGWNVPRDQFFVGSAEVFM